MSPKSKQNLKSRLYIPGDTLDRTGGTLEVVADGAGWPCGCLLAEGEYRTPGTAYESEERTSYGCQDRL